MKFEDDSYFFKHENCMDVFLVVDTVVMDSGNVAIIYGNWMTQGTAKYWAASNRERIKIDKDQYKRWIPYTPKGEYYSG